MLEVDDRISLAEYQLIIASCGDIGEELMAELLEVFNCVAQNGFLGHSELFLLVESRNKIYSQANFA